jgi:hypothetical protein
MPTAKRDIASRPIWASRPSRRRALAFGAGLALAGVGIGAAGADDGPVETYRIRAAIETIDHWVFVRQVLAALPGGRGLDIVRLAPNEAVFDYRFAGDAAALGRALAEKGLDLAPEGDSGWSLKAAESGSAPPSPSPPPAGPRRP